VDRTDFIFADALFPGYTKVMLHSRMATQGHGKCKVGHQGNFAGAQEVFDDLLEESCLSPSPPADKDLDLVPHQPLGKVSQVTPPANGGIKILPLPPGVVGFIHEFHKIII